MRLTVVAALALVYFGVVRVACFLASCFVILFVGSVGWELMRSFSKPRRKAA